MTESICRAVTTIANFVVVPRTDLVGTEYGWRHTFDTPEDGDINA